MGKAREQRKFSRLPIRTSVFVSGDTFDRFKTNTMDFSDGGLFVESPTLAALDAGQRIKVQSAEAFDSPPILTAEVAWTNRFGAGIRYLLDE